eukprot:2632905-Prymnesium_polylepis.1
MTHETNVRESGRCRSIEVVDHAAYEVVFAEYFGRNIEGWRMAYDLSGKHPDYTTLPSDESELRRAVGRRATERSSG